LTHEDFLLKVSVEEGAFNVSRVSVHATGGHESENNIESAEFNDGREVVGLVNTMALAEALDDKTGFEAIDRAIGIRLEFKDLFVANGVTTKGEISHAKRTFVMKGCKL
jgi:hypothetical protein